MEKRSSFTIKSTIELQFKTTNLCNMAYNAYLPEFNIKKSKRSDISLEKLEKSLVFNIESNDITAFRATVNEIVNFGKIIEETYQLSRKS
jgi:tRNA threonylcarbamoyladenosine modification (KEOPS) complex  Pcc1 subunit